MSIIRGDAPTVLASDYMVMLELAYNNTLPGTTERARVERAYAECVRHQQHKWDHRIADHRDPDAPRTATSTNTDRRLHNQRVARARALGALGADVTGEPPRGWDYSYPMPTGHYKYYTG